MYDLSGETVPVVQNLSIMIDSLKVLTVALTNRSTEQKKLEIEKSKFICQVEVANVCDGWIR